MMPEAYWLLFPQSISRYIIEILFTQAAISIAIIHVILPTRQIKSPLHLILLKSKMADVLKLLVYLRKRCPFDTLNQVNCIYFIGAGFVSSLCSKCYALSIYAMESYLWDATPQKHAFRILTRSRLSILTFSF